MTKKKYLDLFKALITIGLLFTLILQSRRSIPEKLKAKQVYKNLFISTAEDKKFKISISFSSYIVCYIHSIAPFHVKKIMKENTELREKAKLRLMCLPCLNIYNQGHSFRTPFFKRSRR